MRLRWVVLIIFSFIPFILINKQISSSGLHRPSLGYASFDFTPASPTGTSGGPSTVPGVVIHDRRASLSLSRGVTHVARQFPLDLRGYLTTNHDNIARSNDVPSSASAMSASRLSPPISSPPLHDPPPMDTATNSVPVPPTAEPIARRMLPLLWEPVVGRIIPSTAFDLSFAGGVPVAVLAPGTPSSYASDLGAVAPAPMYADTVTRYRMAVVSAIYYEDEYLVEWLTYHRALGVEHFYLYDLRPFSRRSARVLRPFIRAKLVTLVVRPEQWRWSLPRLLDQVGAIHRVIRTHSHHVEWLMVMDVDEFWVLPPGCDTIVCVAERERARGFDSVHIPWILAGAGRVESAPPVPVVAAYPKVVGSPIFSTTRYVHQRLNGKTVFRAKCLDHKAKYSHPHDAPLYANCTDGPVLPDNATAEEAAAGTARTGYLMHYTLKSYDAFMVKRGRSGYTGIRDDVLAIARGRMTNGGHWNSLSRDWHAEWEYLDDMFSRENNASLVELAPAIVRQMRAVMDPTRHRDYVRQLPPRALAQMLRVSGVAADAFGLRMPTTAEIAADDGTLDRSF
eukprot:TRINITY_DN12637_c0_g1_i1.p1 TRINITY_DN12637_c0_g1~~TRINITY_DN12637_c0_g1_i1.p1  ORF type:complete len:564 (-),score=75.67 TRINITY_DN12637_c0_g1_i1:129-1820(-)